MFSFLKKDDSKVSSVTNSAEYDTILKRISDLVSEIRDVQAELKVHKTDLADLRGTINSRLAKIQARSKDQPQEDLSNSDPMFIG